MVDGTCSHCRGGSMMAVRVWGESMVDGTCRGGSMVDVRVWGGSMVDGTCVADTSKHFTLIYQKDVSPSISEGRLYSHNGTISEYMVSSVHSAYSADPPHSSP